VRLRKPVLAGLALLAVGPVIAGTLPSAAAAPSASTARPLAGADSAGFPGAQEGIGDVDRRGPRVAPLAGARGAVTALGAGTNVSWTQYGTVLSLTRTGGYLARGVAGATPEAIARTFLARSAAMFGLTAAQVAQLQLVSALPLPESTQAHVVLLRQRAGALPLAQDGLLSVGVRGRDVAIVTSSAVPAATLARFNGTSPTLTPLDAVLAAARDAGVTGLTRGDLALTGKTDSAGFTLVTAQGLAQPQRARLRALATTDRGTRLVWETDILDVAGTEALATMSYVDAANGTVLLRRDAVDTAAQGSRSSAAMRSIATRPAALAAPTTGSFAGTFTPTSCSAALPLSVPAGTQSLAVGAHATNPANDIVLKVLRNGAAVGSSDTATTPEATVVTVSPAAKATDVFAAQVCPYTATSVSAPYDFLGNYATSEETTPAVPGLPSGLVPGGDAVQGPATWRAFSSNPTLPTTSAASPDDRDKICATTPADKSAKAKGCSTNGFTYFDQSPFAYDVDGVTGVPTFTTSGNNAVTSNAQASTSLTPGGPLLPPVSPTRDYAPAFTDAWHTSKCDPVALADPTRRADIDASVVNLFVGHNRIHDFAYRLGLTEPRGAMQVTNFGKGGAEGDPEVGNAQNAALTHAVVSQSGALTGRNNANQITLQDGVPGITNQYLFQPQLGFYAPCADGGLDATIFLHEYTHAISNRLIAGPDTGLSGAQGGSMGESWSDLVAVEYLNAFGLAGKRGEDPFALGAYATGDKHRGIRDFNLRTNPLNYGDFGFDTTGPEVHADGEIWNGVQIAVRQALVEKYRSRYNPQDLALQAACALGRTAAGAKQPSFEGCPGNRRWVTFMFDSMILQANGSPSMVDMKNAQLAADMLRTGGADQRVMAEAFAKRGLGAGSSAKNGDDTHPTPSFAAPTAASNGKVTFALVDARTGKPVKGDVFVGSFQARTTPIASTDPATKIASAGSFVAGTYPLTVQAKGFGLQRAAMTVAAGSAVTKRIALQPNVASATQGAAIQGTGWVRLGHVIDDTEATNGGVDGSAAKTAVNGQSFTVALAGKQRIARIAVSALHRPVSTTDKTDFQGRLLGLHQFEVQASSDGGKTYRTVYTSPENFFPTRAPRAVAPDLQLRTVALPKAVTADHLRLVVRSNTCTGTKAFRGDPDNDPGNNADCPSTANAYKVTVTEFQAYSR
jgi:hypothetical protein